MTTPAYLAADYCGLIVATTPDAINALLTNYVLHQITMEQLTELVHQLPAALEMWGLKVLCFATTLSEVLHMT